MSHSKGLKDVFSYNSWIHAVSGASGALVAMSAFYPLDTVRSRLQLEDPEKRKNQSTWDVLRQLVTEEGFSTLYRGLVPVLESLCISNFVYFYTFHSLKAMRQTGRGQSAIKDLLMGAVAGVVNVLSTTPCWVVNTRLKMKGIKASGGEDRAPYTNLFQGLLYVAQKEGISGLWAGTIPSLVLVINPALQFMMYEGLKRRLVKMYGELPALGYFLAGAVAKAFATVLTYPLQLIQTKMRHGDRNANLPPNAGTIEILLFLLKSHGPAGLFRGLEAKLLQTVLTAALMFATYEKIAKYVTMILTRQVKAK
ncbi:peroxisomal membrane protein PMP34 [Phlebotomus argentipes]|uniref:peroxisomal membrane protein PMP34 n=1 Tax=Phlebotomus argentipes TaxID=94469 RepID=UPI0028931B1E|nr:peroxisomal membrane protein PMP34 [Phlebotomus argentipes]